MGVSRRALLAVAVLSASAGLALACSSFSDSGETLSPDAGAPESAAAADADADAEGVDGADAGVAPGPFCQLHPNAILCDDFEADGGSVSAIWQRSTEGGTIAATTVPGHEGHLVQMAVKGPNPKVWILAPFAPAKAVAGVVFEYDMLVDALGYEYMDLGWVHTAGQSSAYFGGVAKGGMVLGQAQAPQAGPNIPLDRQWHHVSVELRQDGLVPPSFRQIASLDAKVISDTKVDLSGSGSAQIQLGALVTITGLGMENALLGYDNVILRSR